MFSLVRNCQMVFQNELYHFVFLPAMSESSCGCTSLPAFCVVSVLVWGHTKRHVAVSPFISNSGKPGVLQSMGSQRVGHDLATEDRDFQSGWKVAFNWYLHQST